MDVFVEQIVKRRLSVKDGMIFFGIALLVMVLVFLCIAFLLAYVGMIAFLVILGVLYGAYWLITSRNWEFEYSVTNGDLTIDKIINRQRRKRIISFDVKLVEEFGKYDAVRLANRNFDHKYYVGEYEDGRNSWYLTCRTPKAGHVMVVFDPNESVLEAIKPFLPRQVRFETFGRK